ncbi:MAG: hypothetical protein RJA20_804 [Bacteroidota bacterium]
MIIHFGFDFDGPVSRTDGVSGQIAWLGPRGLLRWLEAQLGLGGYPPNTDYIRVELYRQALGQFGDGFYMESFRSDRFATAESLLVFRDELLGAGWNFETDENTPPRLAALAGVETIFRSKMHAPGMKGEVMGFSDRFELVISAISRNRINLKELYLHEEAVFQLPVIRRVLAALEKVGCRVIPPSKPAGNNPQIVVLNCRRDSDAAVFLAHLLRENQSFRPVMLTSGSSLMLEQSLTSESLPAMGIPSASLARPSLQALKLAPAFLWEPVDVFKVMEFLTLPVKPLNNELALEIARVMAEKPGFFSANWIAAVEGFFENNDPDGKIREQYNFWFRRPRFSADRLAPAGDAEAVYSYLFDWAHGQYEDGGKTDTSLLLLAEQAGRIAELLRAIPEQWISYLELERIVRTIIEAAPMQITPAEAGALQFIRQPGALAGEAESLVWWNFVHNSDTPPPDKWRNEERDWLSSKGVHLRTQREISRMNQILTAKPLNYTTGTLVLVVPDQVDGAETPPHLLLSDLKVRLGDKFDNCVYHTDNAADRERLRTIFRQPARVQLQVGTPARPRAQVYVKNPNLISGTEYETPTNLESLFYYPHRWFFRQKLRLFPSSLLSVTGHTTLLGSLAHRIFEILLEEPVNTMGREDIFNRIDAIASDLLPREGAPLLLYGREPERNAFIRRVKNAAWNLVSIIRDNGWAVEATEIRLEGEFCGIPVRGKADLVLRRNDERAILDIKWSGINRRRELIRNGEDLQLVLYAHLLPPEGYWPHTAYFILEDGKLVARNDQAFRQALQASAGSDHAIASTEIFERMERTYQWRVQQISNGIIEIRTERTAAELESLYEGQLTDLLEMKQEESRYDDYRGLLE